MEELKKCPICGKEELKDFLELKDWFLTDQKFSIMQCAACGFRLTNPRPFPEILGSYYKSEEYISHSNNKKGMTNKIYQLVRNRTIKKKYQLINKSTAGKKLLDIGCATGEFLNYFYLNKWEVFGIEPDEDARAIAEKNYNIQVEDEDYLININEKTFDVVTMWHVLEHVYDINARIKCVKNILKDDGLMVVAVPNADSWDAEYYQKYWAAYDVPRHLSHFTPKDIKSLMLNNGMEVVDIKPMKFDSFYVSLLSEKYKNKKYKPASAFLKGLKSNKKAKADMNYSSLIYLVKKK